MFDPKLAAHQRDMQRAYEWLEFVYANSKTLLDAFRGSLSGGAMPGKEVYCCAVSGSRAVTWRYVWLEAFWYLPDEVADTPAFVAVTYHSSDFIGPHLVVGTAEVKDDAGLIERPTQTGHWILDAAFGSSENPRAFSTKRREDGLVQYIVGDNLSKECGPGVRGLLAAPFPVAWFDSPERLASVAGAFLDLIKSGDGSRLGRLSTEAAETLEGPS